MAEGDSCAGTELAEKPTGDGRPERTVGAGEGAGVADVAAGWHPMPPIVSARIARIDRCVAIGEVLATA
jgi:hypothetical protein